MKIRIMALILNVLMIITILPTWALVEETKEQALPEEAVTEVQEAESRVETQKAVFTQEEMYEYTSSSEEILSYESVTLPESLSTIGSAAFMNCINLTGVSIPASVYYIGYYAFADCYMLEEIQVAENNENYKSMAGVLYDK